jgi:hypothetical protein
MRRKIVTVLLLILICFHTGESFAAVPEDIRDYNPPPYSYTSFNGGNCTWFAWEMAYQ